MDLTEQIKRLIQAIKDAMEDNRLSLRELLQIMQLILNILAILLPALMGKAVQAEKELTSGEQ